MNSRSLIPVGLLALLLSSTAGCKKDEPPKPDPAVAAASASAKGKMNVRGPLGPMAKIDPQAMKDYRLDICYYGTFTLRQARDSYFASLGKDEPSEKKIPNFGIASPPATTPTTAPSGSAKAGVPSPNPSANVAPPASGSPRIGAAKPPTPTGLPLKNPPGAASGTIPGADRRPLDFAMRAPHERNARACTAAAALKEPAMGDVDLAVGAYAPFAVDLAKDISAANNYYTRGEYKDDAFAKEIDRVLAASSNIRGESTRHGHVPALVADIRDGQPITSGFRLNDLGDELTLRVKPQKTGLLIAGVTLAVFLIGIPMWIAATPKVWASPGRPGGNLSFRRLKKAR